VLPVIEQRQIGELRIEFDAALESRLGAGFALDRIRRLRQSPLKSVEQIADADVAQALRGRRGRRRNGGARDRDYYSALLDFQQVGAFAERPFGVRRSDGE